MGFIQLHQLDHDARDGVLMNSKVEVSGQIIGFVSSLITDKYDRLIGIEVNLYQGNSSLIVPIPHSWIKGFDEDTGRIHLNIPAGLERHFTHSNGNH